MKITKRSPYTGKMNTFYIKCTDLELERWRNGMCIQQAMPNLTPSQREFVMNGYTPEDWENMFGREPGRDD